ncbi:MAG TPA: glutamine synthetase family protein [Actinomycetota bacterium]|jgi:glutamine synthetase
MGPEEITRREQLARELAERLPGQGVRSLAMTVVDNGGITRVKTVPVSLFERTARFGVGLTPVFEVGMVNDYFTSSPEINGPAGDLRLLPDPSAVRVLAAQPGWAWAPADKYTQEGEVWGACQRSFTRRMAERAADMGFDLRFGTEVEWYYGRQEEDGTLVPIHEGPGYSMGVLAQISDLARDLVVAFEEEGVGVDQFHPEYALGQLEISLPPHDPVGAADTNVLVRSTIRAVGLRHGWRTSFSPVVIPGHVGNGGHLHMSVWQDGANLFSGGNGPHGMTEIGESFAAGILAELPALVAVGSPSVASYLRLVPSHWAGVYACWGRENREAALRFVTGMVGSRESAANLEVKCFDLSANPYLAIGATIAAGLEGVERKLRLPAEFVDDPATHSPEELESMGVHRLPSSLADAVSNLERSDVLVEAMGPTLFNSFTAVRKGESETFAGKDPEEIAAAHRWRY